MSQGFALGGPGEKGAGGMPKAHLHIKLVGLHGVGQPDP